MFQSDLLKDRVILIAPKQNAFGTNQAFLTANDGVTPVTQPFTLNVMHLNQNPSIVLKTNDTVVSILGTKAGVMTVPVKARASFELAI